ncbi:MAG: NADH-quinone oxidoreductase subunit M, partial [Alphaproteobacteria bacterium]|nr:NADH-quinone oxidoreductase subunit M [Alphaproteobacteria bacterium]
ISLQMLPEAGMLFAPMMIVLSIIAIIYASFVAFAQTDMKKLIAYSSVAHMGFVTLGLFSMNEQGLDGAMFVILSHSFVSAALFMGVGVAYDRLHTREIARFGGMASNMPQYAMFFMIFTLAAVGLPGTSGFTGEFLSLLGAYKANIWIAVFAGLGIILGAVYMLSLYRRLFFGKQDKEDVSKMPDLSVRESLCFAPLAVLVFWIGLYPSTFSNQYSATMKTILERLVQ